MRAQRLVMEGFLAYRSRTEVDFTDADLFVLSGPTGAGKSSVIDGITFALYGTIPRLDDRRSVAPVISARSERARVSLQFTVGEDVYVIARLVERRGGGASTTEATLEHLESGETLARGADEVTSAVGDLLGLTFDHFTKAVVLPQGAFADFLTDKPRDRQSLLRALLGIDLYERVMQLANSRAKTAEGRAQALEESLEKLDVPTEDQLASARQALALVEEAAEHMSERVTGLTVLEHARDQALAAVDAARKGRERLESVPAPDGLEGLDRSIEAATTRLAAAEAVLTDLVTARGEIEAAIATHPPLATLVGWRQDRAAHAERRDRLGQLGIEALEAAVAGTAAERDRVRQSLDALRIEHSAHELSLGLAIGGECPVCGAVVESLPDPAGPGAALESLVGELQALEAAAAAARDRFAEATGEAKALSRQIDEIEARLSASPPAEEVEASLVEAEALSARLAEIDSTIGSARAEEAAAREDLQTAKSGAAALRNALVAARDRVAADGPPIPLDDVVESWRVFEEWRRETLATRLDELEAASAALAGTEETLSAARGQFESWLASVGVEATGGAPETDLALAVERRRASVQEMEKTLTESIELAAALEAERARATVAAALGTHLRSNNFEAWLLEEAMDTLVGGANALLADLSDGAYSLVVRDSQFEVVDHKNADLTRTTKSLSGGETFLLSLALSLSMADQLAELTGRSSRLESVFLDEGFGTLDQESLDDVAAVLDELAGRGRTVGIVTHVRDLADRMPVRYEVSKGPDTAEIVRREG